MSPAHKRCIACGAPVRPMLMRSKSRDGASLSFGSKGALTLRDPRWVVMMCDRHFPIWLSAAQAKKAWARKVAPSGLALSHSGFGRVAKSLGLSFRTLKRRLRRQGDARLRKARRALGRSDIAWDRARRILWGQYPWLAHALAGLAPLPAFALFRSPMFTKRSAA